MRILCVYPALLSGWQSYVPHGNNESSYMNHGFAMLSAVLKRAGHQPFLVDLRSLTSWEHFEQTVRGADYDFSMVTFLSCDEGFARQATEIMKSVAPEKTIVGGGIHLSVMQANQYPNIDTIVLGEGEEWILQIASDIEAGRSPAPVYEVRPVADLDLLPFVDRGFFNPTMEETSPLLPLLPAPFVTIVAGRGCWAKCTFCAPTRTLISGKGCRIRTVGHLLEEICQINSRPGGIGSLMIHDDLLGSRTWMAEFISEWKKHLPRIPFFCQLRADSVIRIRDFMPDLAEIGLTWVSLGLESGSQRMLDFLQKGTTVEQNIEAAEILHSSQVNIFGNYIMGLPTETEEDVRATERMLAEVRPAWHSQSIFTSYPGSYLYEWIRENDYWVGPDEHYRRIRYPWERKIKGIDYDALFRVGAQWSANYRSDLREYTKRMDPTAVVPVKTDRPKISVIMLSYRRPTYLKEAVQSMLAQTFQDWELIILDNSPAEDADVREVCEWAATDPRVRVVYHDYNLDNLAHDWNEGLDLARGDYWGLLDDDDRKHPTFCEKMVGYLEAHPAKDAVVCGVNFIGTQAGQRIARPEDVDTLRAGNKIGSGEIVYRRSVIDKIGYFDERMTCQEDWDYVLRFFSRTGRNGAGFLGEILADYRWHPEKRMVRSHELGMVECARIIQAKQQPATIKLLFESAQSPHVTDSQRQVVAGVRQGLASLPFVEIVGGKPDLTLIMGPLYCFAPDELKQKREQWGAPVMMLLMEDPQGMTGNLPHIDGADWLVSNDAHAADFYRTVFHTPDQIYLWNCLSLSESVLDVCRNGKVPKQYDLCFIGYSYPSRVEFISRLRGLLPDIRMVLVGDTWDGCEVRDVTTYPTLAEVETAKIGMASRIVLCKHRTSIDIGGFPVVVPGSVNRGYIECAYGAVVMIDRDRPQHSLGDVALFYSDAEDAAEKIRTLLGDQGMMDAYAGRARHAAPRFTYRERVGRILNSWRSPRYNVTVE